MQSISEKDSQKAESNDVVLHRYIDFDGKEHALGKKYHEGTNELDKFWYLRKDMKREYLLERDLIEVRRDDKHLKKPKTIYFTHIKNRTIFKYVGTLDIAGKDLSVSGFCLDQKGAEKVRKDGDSKATSIENEGNAKADAIINKAKEEAAKIK